MTPGPGSFDEQDRRGLARGVVLGFAGSLGRGLTPLFFLLATRLHGSDAFGLWVLTLAPTELAIHLASGGFSDGVLRFAARRAGEPLSPGAAAAVRAALVGVVLVALLAPLLALPLAGALVAGAWDQPRLAPVLIVMSLNVPVVAVTMVLLAIPRAALQLGPETAVRGVLVPATLFALGAALATGGGGVWELTIAWSAANLVGLAGALVAIRGRGLDRLRGPTDPAARGALLRFALPQGLNAAVTQALWNLDVVLLGMYAAPAQVARYRAASEIARLLFQIRTTFASTYAALAARLSAAGDEAGLAKSFAVVTGWVMVAAGPIVGGVILFRAELLAAYDPAFADPDPVFFVLLAAAALVACALGLSGNVLVMSGHALWNLANGAVAAAVMAALAVALAPTYGALGAAIASSTATALLMIAQTIEARRLVGLRVPVAAIAAPVIVAGIALAAATGIRAAVGGGAGAVGGGVVYVATVATWAVRAWRRRATAVTAGAPRTTG